MEGSWVLVYQVHLLEVIILKAIQVINRILPYQEFQAANFLVELNQELILILEVSLNLLVVDHQVEEAFIKVILILVVNI